jgi:transcriptional regulator with XRE-family HTH domain
MASIDIAIGLRAKVLRVRKGHTAEQMAEMLGVSTSQLAKWESGVERMGAATLFDYTRALELPLSTLFEWSGERLRIASDRSP